MATHAAAAADAGGTAATYSRAGSVQQPLLAEVTHLLGDEPAISGEGQLGGGDVTPAGVGQPYSY